MLAMERTAVVMTDSEAGLTAVRRYRLTPLQWLICAVACLGFAFDTYEITVFSIVARPSLASFGLHPGTAEFNRWVGCLCGSLKLPAGWSDSSAAI
jgi:hypothetical protein